MHLGRAGRQTLRRLEPKRSQRRTAPMFASHIRIYAKVQLTRRQLTATKAIRFQLVDKPHWYVVIKHHHPPRHHTRNGFCYLLVFCLCSPREK